MCYPLNHTSMTEKEVDLSRWATAEKLNNIWNKLPVLIFCDTWQCCTLLLLVIAVSVIRCHLIFHFYPFTTRTREGCVILFFSGGRESDAIIQSEPSISHSNTNERRGAMSGCEGSGSVAVLDETRVPSWFAYCRCFTFTGDFLWIYLSVFSRTACAHVSDAG